MALAGDNANPTITRAVWSAAFINALPDDAFAFIEDGGSQDADGKTTPRSLRHLPYKDADGTIDPAHLRNALARLSQTAIPAKAKKAALARLSAAARKVGIDVSDDAGRAAPPAAVTRSAGVGAGADEGVVERRVVLPATVRITDPARREFEVCATSEAVDSFQTVFSYEASRDAFLRWQARNIREMHQPIAAGKAFQITPDDAERKIYVRGRISAGAESTWLKLQDGVLQGASIGASNVKWERQERDGKMIPVATRYDMVELSLVDNPSNPDALGVTFIRAAQPDADLFDDLPADEVAAWDPMLRDVELEGAGAVAPQGTSNGDVSAQFSALDGPPADPEDETFAASPDEDVLGSHVDGTSLPPVPSADTPPVGVMAVPSTANPPPGNPGHTPRRMFEPIGAPPAALRGNSNSGNGGGPRPSLSARVGALAQQAERTPLAAETIRALAPGETPVAPPAEPLAEAAPAAMPPNDPNDPPLAPFGYGAPTPVNRGALPTKRQQRDAERAAERALGDEVARAGDLAMASVPPWDAKSGETYDLYARRIALARGAAERVVLERQYAARQERALAEADTIIVRTTTPQGRPTLQVRPGPAALAAQAERVAQAARTPTPTLPPAPAAAVADMAPVVAPTETPVMAPAADTTVRAEMALSSSGSDGNGAIVPTASMPAGSTPAGEPALGSGRTGHKHSHPHSTSFQRHEHGHEHTHLDGTTHSHAHAHLHDHHDHGQGAVMESGMRAMLPDGSAGHAHDHLHVHDHSHTYRAGQPTDTALVVAEATRATTRAGRAPQPLARPGNPAAPGGLHPVSGSAQSATTEQPKPPQMSVQPSTIGHMDLLGTEDENAVDFGVPAEVLPVPTPSDLEVTAPAGLHEGGHTPGNVAFPAGLAPANNTVVQSAAVAPTPEIPHGLPDPTTSGPADGDGDHDGDEDAEELATALSGGANAPYPGTNAMVGLDAGARAPTDNSAIVATALIPPAAGKLGRSADANEGMTRHLAETETETETEANGPATADTTRKGARISADSRAALHAARDAQVGSLKNLCAHCGCEQCQGHLDALSDAEQQDQSAGRLATPEAIARAAEVLGQQRLLAALIARGVAQEAAPLVRLVEQQQTLIEALTARIADFELTLADASRQQQVQANAALNQSTQASALRAAEGETTTRLATALDERFAAFSLAHEHRMAQQITALVETALAPVAQRLEAVAEDASELKAGVARIEATPLPLSGPVLSEASVTAKMLPLAGVVQATRAAGGFGPGSSDPYSVSGSGNGAAGGATPGDPATTIAHLQALARQTNDPALQQRLAALVMDLQPNARRLLGAGNPRNGGR